jgi:predicted nucleic-acid-binding protein
MPKAFVDTSVILRILIKDDELKAQAAVNLLKGAAERGVTLYLLPVAVLETVWVLEKVYSFSRKDVQEVVEAILNTPELRIEKEAVFRKALQTYVEKNIKFADAVMGYWGLANGYNIVFTYDEKDFKRIEGLDTRKP